MTGFLILLKVFLVFFIVGENTMFKVHSGFVIFAIFELLLFDNFAYFVENLASIQIFGIGNGLTWHMGMHIVVLVHFLKHVWQIAGPLDHILGRIWLILFFATLTALFQAILIFARQVFYLVLLTHWKLFDGLHFVLNFLLCSLLLTY